MYFILTIVLIPFTILSNYSLFKFIINSNIENDIEIYFSIHSLLSTFSINFFLNFSIFILLLLIMKKSIQILKQVKEIKSTYYILNKKNMKKKMK